MASNTCSESHLARPSNPARNTFHLDSEMASKTAWKDVSGMTFVFSLYMNSLLELKKDQSSPPIFGYFKGLHRGTASIKLASLISATDERGSIGYLSVLSLRKFCVDRLGRISEVTGETRTWRGAAYT